MRLRGHYSAIKPAPEVHSVASGDTVNVRISSLKVDDEHLRLNLLQIDLPGAFERGRSLPWLSSADISYVAQFSKLEDLWIDSPEVKDLSPSRSLAIKRRTPL